MRLAEELSQPAHGVSPDGTLHVWLMKPAAVLVSVDDSPFTRAAVEYFTQVAWPALRAARPPGTKLTALWDISGCTGMPPELRKAMSDWVIPLRHEVGGIFVQLGTSSRPRSSAWS